MTKHVKNDHFQKTRPFHEKVHPGAHKSTTQRQASLAAKDADHCSKGMESAFYRTEMYTPKAHHKPISKIIDHKISLINGKA